MALGVNQSVLLTLCAAIMVAMKVVDAVYIEDTDRFPGWKGELPQAVGEKGANTIGYGEGGVEEWRGEVKQISWNPRAFTFKKFLSDSECDHLINNAKDHLTNSMVVNSDTGKSMNSTVRTSTGAFYGIGHDEIIRTIERRISHVSFLPVENGEGLQILHYQDGEKYEPHHDYFHDTKNTKSEDGGQRVATVLMYLTTPEEGGETVFPSAEPKSTGPEWSECAKKGLSVKAIRGDALLFYALKPNGEPDPNSLHGSCPTLKGAKFSATKWIHVSSRGGQVQPGGVGGCVDMEARCPTWAAAGECKNTPAYMLVNCRKSCNTCTPADAAAVAALAAAVK